MNENLVFIRKIKQNGQLGSLLWDVKAKRAWFTPEILPKSRALRWLMWTVLFLLPPTVALFIVLFVVKRDPLDALLIVLHAALFFRRAIPHAVARVSVRAKRILEG